MFNTLISFLLMPPGLIGLLAGLIGGITHATLSAAQKRQALETSIRAHYLTDVADAQPSEDTPSPLPPRHT